MEEAQQRLTEENDILTALDNQHFALWMQPQVEIASGKILSAEALLRCSSRMEAGNCRKG